MDVRFEMERVYRAIETWMPSTGLTCRFAVAFTSALCVLTAASASAACGQVEWRTLWDGRQRCPRSHSVLSDWSWQRLRWTTWNGSRAAGHGTAAHRSGTTVDERDRIEIELFRVRRCSDGKRIYTRIKVTWHYPDTVGHLSWPYYCTPRLVNGGGGGGG
jgi:hypothetical protein